MTYWISGILLGLILCAWFIAPALTSWLREQGLVRAIRKFRAQQRGLESQFFQLAKDRGKPRGLRWSECDWKDMVRFARDRKTGLLTAFSGVEIHFEAIEGGDMEDVEAVSEIRDGSALFHYQHGIWGTGGKALFNMGPDLALEKLGGQYEPINL